MSMIKSFGRAAGAFVLVGAAAGCNHDAEVLRPQLRNDLFHSYVAIGNSITAGMQASGIVEATQRQSYAFLLAQQMGTRFAIPALASPGCPALITDWRTEGRPAGVPPCALRNAASATDVLNNLGVPDAGTTEVNAPGTTAGVPPYHNALTTLFLGGKTQVQRAIEARPTFVTIWVGNMDALPAASLGMLGGNAAQAVRPLTPLADFQANYDDMIADLLAGAPNVKGMLAGVVGVAGAPRFFSVTAFQNATFRAAFEARAGGAITVHPNCTAAPGSSAAVSFLILHEMRKGTHPRLIVCGANTPGVPAPAGDIFILDATEQITLQQRINDYNAYIQAKAATIGFGYWNPNDILASERTPTGCIAVTPDPAAPANGSPFGSCVSNDGVHPSAAGQRLLANALIAAINAEYETTIPAVP